MKRAVRLSLKVISIIVLLFGVSYSNFAAGLAGATSQSVDASNVDPSPAEATCKKFEITSDNIVWYATSDDHSVDPDSVVESYPSGSNTIAAGFEYKCNPKTFKLSYVWYTEESEDEPFFSDSYSLKAITKPDLFWTSVYFEKGDPLPDGKYRIEFFNGKTKLLEGEVEIGGGGDDGGGDGEETVEVGIKVTDSKSKKPIKDATFVVLAEEEDPDAWMENDQPEDVILSSCVTDRSGGCMLPDRLDRNTPYNMVAFANKYKYTASTGEEITDQDPDPLVFDVPLSK